MNKIFTSKRDNATIIRTIIYLTIALTFVFFMRTRSQEKDNVELGLLVLFILVYATGVLLTLRTTYKITPDGLLIINAGLRKIRMHISDMHSAVIQHSYGHFITSPFASSVYQVKISYKKHSVIVISPANQDDFIHSLQMHNPGIIDNTGTYAV